MAKKKKKKPSVRNWIAVQAHFSPARTIPDKRKKESAEACRKPLKEEC